MRLKVEQLPNALQKGLSPVYFLTGDEPLQLGELADAIRKSARDQSYGNREILAVDKNFNWNELAFVSDSLSIFAEKRIIELRIPSGAPGVEGAKALLAYCNRLPDETILLIVAGKIANSSIKSRWFEALDKTGVIIQVWPLEGADFIKWIQQRLQKRGLQSDAQGVQLLASRVEGNLLAAAQEIEKLYVLYGDSFVSATQIYDVVVDSSRYDVFKLMDTVLAADLSKTIKILSGLKAEGTVATIVLWAFTRDARLLIQIKLALAKGQNKDLVFKNYQIWDKRKQSISQTITRLTDRNLRQILMICAKADRQIKGQESGDAWETLYSICVLFCNPALYAELI